MGRGTWVASLVSEVPALQAWEPKFDPQKPHKVVSVVMHACTPTTGEVEISGAHWPASSWVPSQWETLFLKAKLGH